MHRVLPPLVAVAWGLWFGGLITLFLAVGSLFNTFGPNRAVAGTAAAGIFRLFERYQLGVAAAALVLTFCWRLLPGAPRLKTALFGVFTVATALALVETMVVAREMETLRQQGLTQGERFKSLHGTSMILYVSGAAVLLVGGFLLPPAVRRDGRAAATPATDS